MELVVLLKLLVTSPLVSSTISISGHMGRPSDLLLSTTEAKSQVGDIGADTCTNTVVSCNKEVAP
jgi:hypothetical protein